MATGWCRGGQGVYLPLSRLGWISFQSQIQTGVGALQGEIYITERTVTHTIVKPGVPSASISLVDLKDPHPNIQGPLHQQLSHIPATTDAERPRISHHMWVHFIIIFKERTIRDIKAIVKNKCLFDWM